MLIEADNTILEYFKHEERLSALDSVVVAMNSVLRSVLLRQHIFFSNRETLLVLLDCKYIDLANKAVLQFMLDRYATIGSFVTSITDKIVITDNVGQFVVDGSIYYIDIRKLISIEKARLITEHGSDADAYIEIAYKIIASDNLDGLSIAFEKKSCYGSNVKDAIESCLGSQAFMLCIIDSDKKYVSDVYGTTYNAAYSEVRRLENQEVIALYSMAVKEKENMYPFVWYGYADKNVQNLMDAIEEYGPSEEFLRYYDIKEGVSVKEFKGDDANWQELYRPWIVFGDRKGVLNKSISEINQMPESDVLINGIGSSLAEKVDWLILKGNIVDEYEKKCKLKANGVAIPDAVLARCREIVDISQNVTSNLPEWLYTEWRILGRKIIMWGLSFSEENVPRFI